MNLNLLITKNLTPTINSWTLTSRIGEMLDLAKAMFGEINSAYYFLGIEFKEGMPSIRYQNPNYIIIQLTPNSVENEYLAYYQLSHEVYHLLSPTGKLDSNNLEEGLAIYFSKIYLDRFNQSLFDWEKATKADNKYYTAYQNVDQLLKIQPDIIKKIRIAYPNTKTSYLTIKEFETFMHNDLPKDLLIELLKPFPYAQLKN